MTTGLKLKRAFFNESKGKIGEINFFKHSSAPSMRSDLTLWQRNIMVADIRLRLTQPGGLDVQPPAASYAT